MTLNLKYKGSILGLICLGWGLFTFSGCQSDTNGFQKTPSGLEYKIIENQPGDSTSFGDYMKVSLRKVINDTTILNTANEAPGYRWVQIKKSLGQKYDVMEGLALLTKGDSAEFKLPVEGVKGSLNRPPFVKDGDIIHFFVKVLDVKRQEEFESDRAKQEKEQNQKDAKIIQDYVDNIGKSSKVSEGGVHAIIYKKGTGSAPHDGQSITLMYTGKTLDGEVFDSNEDTAFHHTDPLVFTLGKGMMIPGMEEGVKLLKKGAEATLVLPSSLAYGRRGRLPQIQPNTVLLFDVKVIDIQEE